MKDHYISQHLNTITNIAQLLDRAPAIVEAYYKRGYNSGGTSEILDSDLVTSGITAAQLAAGVTMLEQLIRLRSGQPVAVSDYGATLATLRRDI